MASEAGSGHNGLKAPICKWSRGFLDRTKMRKERKLGTGMSGEVWLVGLEQFPGRQSAKRAVKFFDKNKSADNIRNFITEVTILRNVKHPHIISGVRGIACPTECVISMPYFENGCLSQHIRHLPIDTKLTFFCQITDAVRYLHSKSIVHRDIKPENILLNLDMDGAVLTDFGLAWHCTPEHPDRRVSGSLGYMPPEVFGHKEFDPFKTDTYALGVTLYNMLTGDMQIRSMNFYNGELLKVKGTAHWLTPYRSLMEPILRKNPASRYDSGKLIDRLCRHMETRSMAEELWDGRATHQPHGAVSELDFNLESTGSLGFGPDLAQNSGPNPELAQSSGFNPELVQPSGCNPELVQSSGFHPEIAQGSSSLLAQNSSFKHELTQNSARSPEFIHSSGSGPVLVHRSGSNSELVRSCGFIAGLASSCGFTPELDGGSGFSQDLRSPGI